MAESAPSHSTRYRFIHAVSVATKFLGSIITLADILYDDSPDLIFLIIYLVTLASGHIALVTRRQACLPGENRYTFLSIFGLVSGYLGVIGRIVKAHF